MEQVSSWVTTAEAAELTGLPRRTLLEYIYRGELPAANYGRGATRIRRVDLEAFIAAAMARAARKR